MLKECDLPQLSSRAFTSVQTQVRLHERPLWCDSQLPFGLCAASRAELGVDPALIQECLIVASLDGNVQSCRELALLHTSGKTLFEKKVNLNLARYWLERAAQLSCSASMAQLSRMLEAGSGGYQDLVEAAEWCVKAMLAHSEEGHEMFRKWCLRVENADGEVWSQISSHKGFLSDAEIAVLVDYAQARTTDTRPLILTAILHEHGALGLSRNSKLSVKLLLRTARGGDAGSQYRMALLARQKVEKTFAPEETEEYWLRRAADKLHLPAQHRLAELLRTSAQHSDNQPVIAKLLEDAAKKDYPLSM